MGNYTPSAPTWETLAWLQNELQRIAFAIDNGGQTLRLAVTAVDPTKSVEGEIRIADGVTWDPGRGPGTYIYRNSKWQLIEGGFHQVSKSRAFFLGD